MKKWILAVFLLIGFTAISNRTDAQVRVGININIGTQPDWGPAGYDEVEYYYLPDIESYYYVPSGQFIYLSNGRWIFSLSLPARYSGYDLYSGYKVVVNRRNAYNYFSDHRIRYSGYKNYYGRQQYRGGHYYKNKHNSGYKKYKAHGRGKKNGHWKHRGRYND